MRVVCTLLKSTNRMMTKLLLDNQCLISFVDSISLSSVTSPWVVHTRKSLVMGFYCFLFVAVWRNYKAKRGNWHGTCDCHKAIILGTWEESRDKNRKAVSLPVTFAVYFHLSFWGDTVCLKDRRVVSCAGSASSLSWGERLSFLTRKKIGTKGTRTTLKVENCSSRGRTASPKSGKKLDSIFW